MTCFSDNVCWAKTNQILTEAKTNIAQEFEAIKEHKSYADDYYFIAQMFEVDWKPSHTV